MMRYETKLLIARLILVIIVVCLLVAAVLAGVQKQAPLYDYWSKKLNLNSWAVVNEELLPLFLESPEYPTTNGQGVIIIGCTYRFVDSTSNVGWLFILRDRHRTQPVGSTVESWHYRFEKHKVFDLSKGGKE